MIAREMFEEFKGRVWSRSSDRADLPSDHRLFVFVDPAAVEALVCQHIFRDLDARYVDQHRRRMTGRSPASSWSRTILHSTKTMCSAAC